MSDSLNATEIAVGSLLAGGRGGYAGGAWGSGYQDVGHFGTVSSNAVRIDRNADVFTQSVVLR